MALTSNFVLPVFERSGSSPVQDRTSVSVSEFSADEIDRARDMADRMTAYMAQRGAYLLERAKKISPR